MKRIVLLTALAAMIAAAMALSGVAQARPISEPADAKCAKLAIKTLGPSYNPSNYNFVGGTEGAVGDDNFDLSGTDDPDVICGFGGNDSINFVAAGDIFLGGAGDDFVNINSGTVYGDEGDDEVGFNFGTFNGWDDFDRVINNFGTITNVEQVI